jgi:hypothetical protein
MLQGSSEVCPIWSLSSSVQFEVLNEQFPMAVFPSPWPAIYTACNGKGIVYDITLWEMSLTAELRVAGQSQSMGTRSPPCRRCPKSTQDNLCCHQLELPKEWPACYENYKWRSWHYYQCDPRQQQNSDNNNHMSRSHHQPLNTRSATGTNWWWQNWVSVLTTRGYQTLALTPTSTIELGKYSNRFHNNDIT